MTPAHHTGGFAELVCSNSLRSDSLENANGILKQEMRMLHSLVIMAADRVRIPAGSALAVDRAAFSDIITKAVRSRPNIEIINEEVTNIPLNETVVIATGPLTTAAMSHDIMTLAGSEHLYFYDAASPVVAAESINYNKAFFASRYGMGSDYLNCPMNEEEYRRFYDALVRAECVSLKGFEEKDVFEGCMPIEVMAKRGQETLRFGPLKPVGITDPKTGGHPYALVQLRRENVQGTMYNIVGFQTHLKFNEQKRVFSLIPGLERMEILRYGVMHRNTYINSPKLLDGFGRLKEHPNVFFAGQITGVEGYTESAASGFLAGLMAAAGIKGIEFPVFSTKTATGALLHYVTAFAAKDFQPMNINFGLMEPPDKKIRYKRQKAQAIFDRAISEIEKLKRKYVILGQDMNENIF